MPNIKIYDKPLCENIRSLEKSLKGTYKGVVYFLEYGKHVKIGSTRNPYQRMGTIIRNAVNYDGIKISRVAIGFIGTNFRQIEKAFHHKLDECRIRGTELFDINLEDAISTTIDIKEKDESQKIRSSAIAFKNRMACFVLGRTDINGEHIK